LRLDSFVSDGGASYELGVLTIEHVLSQNISEGSSWLESWPDERQRSVWVHRLANLVPLNKRKNSQAQNYDFDKKKNIYFSGKSGVSSYALTSKVLNESEWTPKVVASRQNELLQVLAENWGIDLEAKTLFEFLNDD